MTEYYDQKTLHRVQNVQSQILQDVLKVCKENEIDVFLVFGSALGVVRHKGFIPWDDDIDVGIFREDYARFRRVVQKELGNKYEFLTCETNKNYACTVTHLQKKGTKFVSRDVVNCDYIPGINIDIFIYDHLADGWFARKKQYFSVWFLGRLLFLSGKGTPYLPYSGGKKIVISLILKIIRGALCLFRITPIKIYHRFQKVSQKYNYRKTRYYAAFEPPKPWLNAMEMKDVYPLKEMPFRDYMVCVPKNVDSLLKRLFGDYMKLPPVEKRVNHRPLVIEFGEE